MARLLVSYLIGIALVMGARAAVAETATSEADPFAVLAYELIDGLAESDAAPPLRVALWPMAAADSPVAPALARDYDGRLLSALLDKGGQRYRFVAREALATVAAELSEAAEDPEDLDRRLAALARSARADVLLVGDLRRSAPGRLALSYRAVQVSDGRLLAATSRVRISLSPSELQAAEGLLGLDQAMGQAARRLTEQAGDLRELRLGAVVPAGERAAYLEARATAALMEAADDPLTGAGLRVVADESPAPGRYRLDGRLWPIGAAVGLHLTLSDADGIAASWQGRIDAGALPADGAPGPGLQLTSGRGEAPVYRIGEQLNLVVRTAEDAWLYCFYRQADGRSVKIFPNAYQASAFLAGGQVHRIPGEAFPFQLTLTPPVGRESVECFAAPRALAAPDRNAVLRALGSGARQARVDITVRPRG